MVEGRVDQRGEHGHGEQPQGGEPHRFSALEPDAVADGPQQGNRQIGRVHEKHGKQQHQPIIQEIDHRMAAGKGISVLRQASHSVSCS